MKEKTLNFKVLIFWLGFACITIIFLVVFGIRLFKVTTFNDLDDVKRANLIIKGAVTTQKEDEYYVYIYSSKAHDTNYAYQEVEPTVFTYFTYVAKNGSNDTVKIYAYDIDSFTPMSGYNTANEYLGSLNSNLKTSSLPSLVKVSNGGVSTTYTTINKITSELQTVMTNDK